MIVEFVGSPGSGKTTVARELATQLDWPLFNLHGHSTLQGRKLTGSKLNFHRMQAFMFQPKLVQSIGPLILKENAEARGFLINLVRRNAVATTIPTRDWVLEEGVTQGLLLSAAFLSVSFDWRRTLSRLKRPDIIVAVCASPAVIQRRIRDRGTYLHDTPQMELDRFVRNYYQSLKALESQLGAPILWIDGEASPDTNSKHIFEFISTLRESDAAQR